MAVRPFRVIIFPILVALTFAFCGKGVSSLNNLLDETFGNKGLVTTQIGANSTVMKLLRQPSGAVVAVGTEIFDATFSRIALARYDSHGELDATLGEGGITKYKFRSSSLPLGATVQEDGKILACGYAVDSNDGVSSGFITRFLPDGALDTGFGTGGTAELRMSASAIDWFQGCAVDSRGRIVAVGFTGAEGVVSAGTIARYLPNGSLDTSFASQSAVPGVLSRVSPGSSGDSMGIVSFDSENRIVVGGSMSYVAAGTTSTYSAVWRYAEDGTIDATFGSAAGSTLGSALPSGAGMKGLFSLADGAYLAIQAEVPVKSTEVFLLRLDATGRPDTSFGSLGLLSTGVGEMEIGGLQAGRLLSNGTVVVASDSKAQNPSGMAMVALDQSGNPLSSDGGKSFVPVGKSPFIPVDILEDSGFVLFGGAYENKLALLRVKIP